jgi:hypothetical protein
MKRLYEITRALSGKNNNPSRLVKDKDRNTISTDPPHLPHQISYHQLSFLTSTPTVNAPSKTEITKTIKSLKSGKAAGPDGIPPEALKADIQTSTEMLHPLLSKIWGQEQVPKDWKRGHLVKLPNKVDLSPCNNWRRIMLLSIPAKY